MNVLITDDDLVSSRIVSKTLAKEKDTSITEANSTEEALELLNNGLLPDLIILDLVFPGMSGEEFLQKLRATPHWKGIPVIVSSFNTDRKIVEKIAKLGVSGYLLKPLEIGRLRMLFREVARKCVGKNALEPATVVMDRLELSEADYAELLELYSNESSRLIKEIRELGKAREKQKLCRLLETLKATSANVGAQAVMGRATKIATLAATSESDQIIDLIDEMEVDKLRTDQEIASRCKSTPAAQDPATELQATSEEQAPGQESPATPD